MKVDQYSVRIFWSDEDDGYIAASPELDGVSAFGETPQSALAELGAARGLWLEELQAMGQEAPPPMSLPRHSGQFRLRVPRSLHAWLAARAEFEGVSLNTLIVQILSEARGAEVGTASDFRRPASAVGVSSSAGASVLAVRFVDESISVDLADGRTIWAPLAWYPRLLNASEEERDGWELAAGGHGIHWPAIDEDLSVEGLLRGAPAPGVALGT